MSVQDDTIQEFLGESLENLDRYDQDLLHLEANRTDKEVINRIFRTVHTIKGTCGFFQFRKLESVSHVGENLLDSLRDGRLEVSETIITALLGLGDALRTILVTIGETGEEGDADFHLLIERLTVLNSSATAGAASKEVPTTTTSPSHQAESSAVSDTEDELAKMFEEASASYSSQGTESPTLSQPQTLVGDETKKADLAETALRVDITLLNKLMNLVGELVLARNQILQFSKYKDDNDFAATSQKLNLITSELQEGVMRTRMQPIGNILNKFPRVVRDVALTCGKQVTLTIQGKETELDKSIIEAIKDPLTHIIRNAVDHGIESPEARVAVGKTPEGTLTIKAYQEGGQIIIEIRDDGLGLNAEKIKTKAVDKGIVSAERAARLSEDEIQKLIFLPGFSTAEKVTNISGRGVGMDVVRSNIERIGGTVDVTSTYGQGSVFTLKIPLTLAIIPALLVTAAGRQYAIPQVSLVELVRMEGDQIAERVEEIHGAQFCRLRGSLLPLVSLRHALNLNPQPHQDVLNIVVVQGDGRHFGLIVDSVCDTEEIVVKPLGRLLKGIDAFAGATIMGDGQLALIIDVVGLARQANISKSGQDERETATGSDAKQELQRILVFTLGESQRGAVLLDQVHRLEKFPASSIERAGGRTVIQYRGGILPLVDLTEVLCGSPGEYQETVRVFVHHTGERSVGFVVDSIVDICEQVVKPEVPFGNERLVGSAVIQGEVTDLVDLPSIITQSGIARENTPGGVWSS